MTAPTVEVAASAVPPVTAASARSIQLAIRAKLLQDVVKLWSALDPKRLDQSWPGWITAMRILTQNYHSQSSAAAGTYYQALRERATDTPTPHGLIKFAPVPSDEWMSKAYGFSGPGMLTRDTARPNTALSTTLGTAQRIVLDGGRTTILDTVHADPKAVGWYRVSDGHPCAFCALLCGRGLAYKSEKAADFKSHNDCGCSAVPAFSHDVTLPTVNDQAAQVYRESTGSVSGKQKLVAFRKAWAQHQNAS